MATKRSNTKAPNPHAAVFEMIRRLAAIWREDARCDERTTKLLRRLRSMVGKNAYQEYLAGRSPETREIGRLLTEKSALNARETRLCSEACDLEWQIALADVHTPDGYSAQCREVEKAKFDKCDLALVAFILGRNAGRLGITDIPSWISDVPMHGANGAVALIKAAEPRASA